MNLIDTHCHIYSTEFDQDRSAMISRAENEGIKKMLMPAIDISTHMQMLALEEAYAGKCLSMMGLHPGSVKDDYLDQLRIVEEYFATRPFAAVGETGLDFYWDLTYTRQQYAAFERQIDLALEHNIPVVIHSRNSTDQCVELIKRKQNGRLKGVFHCFTGSLEQARVITDLNFYLGIGGVLTFKKSGLDQTLEQVELSHVVLETDAPYLAPVPFRGKRNECSYITYVAEKLAQIKNVSREEVASITTANAKNLFNV